MAMHYARRTRLITLFIAVCAILFGQLALAGYRCPGVAKAVEVARMAEAGMPCAQSMSRAMDDESPGLCHAHCQASQQSADTYQVPAMATPLQPGAVFLLDAGLVRPPAVRADPPRPNASPPLAILNCCFRI
jgi:hypothetical protein